MQKTGMKKSALIVSILGVAACLVFAYSRYDGSDRTGESLVQERDRPITRTAEPVLPDGGQPLGKAHPSSSAPTPSSTPGIASLVRPSMLDALHSRNVYATMIALRDRGQPGTYIAARNLQVQCTHAIVAIRTTDEGKLQMSQEFRSLRAQAVQEAEARCGALMQNNALLAPKSDDPSGTAYERLRTGDDVPEDLLRETARQGAMPNENLLGASWSAGRIVYFNGKPFGGFPEINQWMHAVALAQAQLSVGTAMSERSLPSLTRCIEAGACTGTPDDVFVGGPKFSPQTLAEIRATAEQIKAAVLANNPEPFMPPKKTKG